MLFRYDLHPTHLLVTATGPFDADACRVAMGDIARQCSERQFARVLVDARAITELVSIADRFGLANSMATSRLPRIAILVTEANATHSRMFENTAQNRGAMVRTTSDVAEACGFLGIEAPIGRER